MRRKPHVDTKGDSLLQPSYTKDGSLRRAHWCGGGFRPGSTMTMGNPHVRHDYSFLTALGNDSWTLRPAG